MGNINGWGGPLSRDWHKFTLELQHNILDRMRGLGMIPVTPGFAGHIPEGLLEAHPEIDYSTQVWNGFNRTYLLEASDPLFGRIGTAFLRAYREEFGPTDHVYSCDTFNEMDPKTNGTDYIMKSGAAIYRYVETIDDDPGVTLPLYI